MVTTDKNGQLSYAAIPNAGVDCTTATVNGTNAIACGAGANANGANATAFGAAANATGGNTTAIGYNALANASNAAAFGVGDWQSTSASR